MWWFGCSEVQVSARRSRLLARALSPLLLLLPAGHGEQMTLGGLPGLLSICEVGGVLALLEMQP